MNWKQKLAVQAKKTIDARGGTESLKEDAQELRDIARGQGSAKDKLRAAAHAIKTPGGSDAQAEGEPQPPQQPPQPQQPQQTQQPPQPEQPQQP
jgi:hypothetical protein